jgi:hypothetical protein
VPKPVKDFEPVIGNGFQNWDSDQDDKLDMKGIKATMASL